jgi:transposase-like protein
MAAPKRATPAQIINHLRKAEVELANGKSIKEVCRGIGVSEQTYYRWRKEYGGMQVSQAKRMKELEKENQHLRRAVADLTVDNLILKEAKLLSPERRRRCVVLVQQQLGGYCQLDVARVKPRPRISRDRSGSRGRNPVFERTLTQQSVVR